MLPFTAFASFTTVLPETDAELLVDPEKSDWQFKAVFASLTTRSASLETCDWSSAVVLRLVVDVSELADWSFLQE